MSYKVSKILNKFKDHGYEIRRGKFGEFHVTNGSHVLHLYRNQKALCAKTDAGLIPLTEQNFKSFLAA